MSRKRGRPSLPEPLELRRHLDACTKPELAEFLRFWSPHDKHRNGRDQMVEKLYRLMSDENVVYAKVDLLSEKVRAVLLALLRATHYTSDLQGLFRGIDGLEMEYYEGEAALTALARRGFVRVSRAQEWLHYGRSAYAIPKETALVMRGLAGTDRRSLPEVFLHESYRPTSVEDAALDARAPLPESAAAAIAQLPDEDLRMVATEMVERFGGILTRAEFGKVFGERGTSWQSVRFLREFGSRGLGTVGHLDLRVKGFGVDDDALFIFHEVVERYVDEWRARPFTHDLVLSAHGDLMSDVRTTLEQIKEVTVKIAKEGSVYKSARARLSERLQFPLQPLIERSEVTDKALAIVRGLALAANNGDGRLSLTEKGEAWAGRPLLEKVREAYELLLVDEVQTLRSHHLRGVQRIMVGLLTAPETKGQWWPGASLALIARNRYLLELVGDNAPLPNRAPLSITHAVLTELAGAALDLLTRDLYSLGLVDVALRDNEAVGARLSRLGERLLIGDTAPAANAKPLVVNPDFELLVLPEGDVDDLLHALDRVAVRERTGEVVHYRLDRARIERAAVAGESADDLIVFLEEHSRAPLPQNVAYSIRSWGTTVRSATLERGVLFQSDDPAVIEAILNHSVLREYVSRVVDPRTVFFKEEVMERPLTQEFKSLGVYLR